MLQWKNIILRLLPIVTKSKLKIKFIIIIIIIVVILVINVTIWSLVSTIDQSRGRRAWGEADIRPILLERVQSLRSAIIIVVDVEVVVKIRPLMIVGGSSSSSRSSGTQTPSGRSGEIGLKGVVMGCWD